jgi:hypothetical protein
MVPNHARYQAALRPESDDDATSTCSVRALVEPDLVLELAIAPAAALTRVAGAINRKRQRVLGILKTQNEYVGHVGDDAFEIWERQQRAVHAWGRVTGQGGGTRVEVSFGVPMRTRVLIAVFFALYAAVAAGIAMRSSGDALTGEQFAIAIGGALVLIFIFVVAARRQRADLRAFVQTVFTDVPRI